MSLVIRLTVQPHLSVMATGCCGLSRQDSPEGQSGATEHTYRKGENSHDQCFSLSTDSDDKGT
jgi:hypothetical protein